LQAINQHDLNRVAAKIEKKVTERMSRDIRQAAVVVVHYIMNVLLFLTIYSLLAYSMIYGKQDSSYLIKAQNKYLSNHWKQVNCIGIPDSLNNFKITRYKNDLRIDLKSDSNVFSFYEEYLWDTTAKPEMIKKDTNNNFKTLNCNGILHYVNNTDNSIFLVEFICLSAGSRSFYLVAFSENRKCLIHTRGKPTGKNLSVSIQIAKIAMKNIKRANILFKK
jgi:hypothetical protein